MDQSTVNIVNQMLSSLISSTATAKEFLIAQIPDVLHQLLVWKFTSSLLVFLIGVGLLVLLYPIVKTLKKEMEKGYEASEGLCAGLFVIGTLSFCIGVLIISLSTEWLQIWIAPKVYLLEYARRLV